MNHPFIATASARTPLATSYNVETPLVPSALHCGTSGGPWGLTCSKCKIESFPSRLPLAWLEIMFNNFCLLFPSMNTSDHVSSSCADHWCWNHWSAPRSSIEKTLRPLYSLRKRSGSSSSGERMGTYHSLGIAEFAGSSSAAHNRQTTRDLCGSWSCQERGDRQLPLLQLEKWGGTVESASEQKDEGSEGETAGVVPRWRGGESEFHCTLHKVVLI